jgi:purine nucleosidase
VRHGADVIVDEARRRPGQITLLTLGPLTNLAVALEREPALPRLLRRFGFMGGAFGVSGNTTPTTEWNIYCDPDAARAVLRAWAAAIAEDASVPRPFGMGLDVTETARMLPEHVVALARRAGSTPDSSIEAEQGVATDRDPLAPERSVASDPIIRYIADALRWYFEFHRRYDGFYGAFIHDPFVLAAVLDPALVTTEPLFVDVEVSGELTSGMTIADRRHLTGRPPNVDLAVSADATTFLDRLIDRIGDLAARTGAGRPG